ncbi:MAG: sulfatase-like hydrolase/transferase [Cyclobacteriaceae bacterium]|nr:sulfatase-like hydrolase/transferase [Cyclobacteriaceae bacterium]
MAKFRETLNKIVIRCIIAILILYGYSSNFLFGNNGDNIKDRKNIVFILTDDQRFDDLRFTGNTVIKTPNIDKLASEGIIFKNAYVTSAICTPSRASIFLSQHEREHGINFNSGTSLSKDAWENSYPVLLRNAGYFSGYIGKNHVPIGEKGYHDVLLEKSFDFWFAGHGHLGFYPKQVHDIFKTASSDTQIEVLQEGLASFFDVVPKDKPFSLSIAFNLPHGNGVKSMEMRPEDPLIYRDAYRDVDIKVSDLYLAKNEIKIPKIPLDINHTDCRQKSYDYVDSIKSLKEITIRRYQTITGIDQFVGKVRELLRANGFDKNTIIVFTSDHGIMLGEFGLGGKALNYEACVKVPFILFDPSLRRNQKGQVIDKLIQTIDIAPTLLKYGGVDIPESMKGKPLQLLINDRNANWRSTIFCENLWSTAFGNPRIESIREGKWKYIRYFKNDYSCSNIDGNPYAIYPEDAIAYSKFLTSSIEGESPVYEELFDLEIDPQETQNLIFDPEKQEVIKKLRISCQQMVVSAYGDGPKVEPYTYDIIQDLNSRK